MQIFLDEICFEPNEIGIGILQDLSSFLEKEATVVFYFTNFQVDYILDKLQNSLKQQEQNLLLLNLQSLLVRDSGQEKVISYQCEYYLPLFKSEKLSNITLYSIAECAERLYKEQDATCFIISYPSCENNINSYTNLIRKDLLSEKISLLSIPTIENIDDIKQLKKWFYKNITLKENLSNEAYKLVCEKLDEPNSELSMIFQNFDFETWETFKTYFPLLKLSHYLFPNQNPIDFIEQGRKQRTDKGNTKDTNEKFAKLNGYIFDECVTSANQGAIRYVYKAGRGKQRIYISTDFENTEFEVCDFEGKWLGSYGYNGEETKLLIGKTNKEKEQFAKKHSLIVPEKCK